MVPLDTLPERRTMTIHPEISARGSLIPAGDGSKFLSDICTPGTRPRGGGGGTRVYFGWVCAARVSKFGPRFRKNLHSK